MLDFGLEKVLAALKVSNLFLKGNHQNYAAICEILPLLLLCLLKLVIVPSSTTDFFLSECNDIEQFQQVLSFLLS